MNADEIVRALRECGDCDTCPYYDCWIDEHTGDPADACDEGRLFRDVIALIESLTAQLAESQRREKQAVEDLTWLAKTTVDSLRCNVCKYNPNDMGCELDGLQFEDDGECHFEWRGLQEGASE